ncbi:MAG: hypothetical protein JWP08_1708 [Bryobacterales bacterium]|nr:hypothetical protein [Bryobacterales bacterium]
MDNLKTVSAALSRVDEFLTPGLLCVLLLSLGTPGVKAQADAPSTEISNGVVKAKLYMPNPERGYYRGSRFDWSGVIASLEYKGHNFFGVWFPHYDPKLHDAITGPVEEFRTAEGPEGGLGFSEAKPGGHFVKIGVGVLLKPDDEPYSFSRTYDIVTPGTWICRPDRDKVQFIQELKADGPYAYRYEKTVRLVGNKPQLVLEHKLTNTGKRAIETDVYDHDFYVIDGMPTGPDFVVKFPFAPKSESDFKGLATIRGNELVYLKTLEDHESAASFLKGFGPDVKDYDLRVENKKVKAGVRQIGDRPISAMNFWSIRSTVCPEAYIHIKLEPKQSMKWTIRYEFYELDK